MGWWTIKARVQWGTRDEVRLVSIYTGAMPTREHLEALALERLRDSRARSYDRITITSVEED